MDSVIADFLGIALKVCVVFVFLALILYILNGIALYRIAKNNDISGGWMAFVPFARKYLEGKLAGEIVFGETQIENPGIWLFRLPIIFFMLAAPIVLLIAFSLIDGAYTLIDSLEFLTSDMDLAFLNSILTTFLAGGAALFILNIVFKALICGLTGLVRYNIHKKYVSENKAVGHMLLGLFVPLYQLIYYLVLSGSAPLEEE